MADIYHGVGAIVTNEERNLFFVQEKDTDYSIDKWKKALSFWGGGVELADSSSVGALKRELLEEIPSACFILDKADWRFIKKYFIKSDEDFYLSFFEIILPTEVILSLANIPSEEGIAVILSREEIIARTWVWGLGEVVSEYLENN